MRHVLSNLAEAGGVALVVAGAWVLFGDGVAIGILGVAAILYARSFDR